MENFLKGIIVGISNIIPGVSGGTMLVLTGIFDKSIAAITNPFKYWKFLFSLISGIVVGVALFSFFIHQLLSINLIATTYFFIGLIISSLLVFFKKEISKFNSTYFIIGVLVIFLLDYTTWLSSSHILLLLVAGFISGGVVIIPGISGSLVLLVLGQYKTVLGLINELLRLDFSNILQLIYFGLGGFLGLVTSAQLLKKLLQTHRDELMNVVIGLIIGSIFMLIPTKGYDLNSLFAVITLPLGLWIGSKIK